MKVEISEGHGSNSVVLGPAVAPSTYEKNPHKEYEGKGAGVGVIVVGIGPLAVVNETVVSRPVYEKVMMLDGQGGRVNVVPPSLAPPVAPGTLE